MRGCWVAAAAAAAAEKGGWGVSAGLCEAGAAAGGLAPVLPPPAAAPSRFPSKQERHCRPCCRRAAVRCATSRQRDSEPERARPAARSSRARVGPRAACKPVAQRDSDASGPSLSAAGGFVSGAGRRRACLPPQPGAESPGSGWHPSLQSVARLRAAGMPAGPLQVGRKIGTLAVLVTRIRNHDTIAAAGRPGLRATEAQEPQPYHSHESSESYFCDTVTNVQWALLFDYINRSNSRNSQITSDG